MVLVLASSTNKEFFPVFATREVIFVLLLGKFILVMLVHVLVLNVDGSLWYTCNCPLETQLGNVDTINPLLLPVN
jgi:hypothetical protein